MTSDVNAFPRNDTRGSYLVLGEGDTRDEVSISGRWLAIEARGVVDLGAWR